MGYFEYGDRLYEFTLLQQTGSEDWSVECMELSNPHGFFGVITIANNAELSTLEFHAATELPLAVLRRWLSILEDTAKESSTIDG